MCQAGWVDPNDATTWQAFNALLVTLLGLIISALLWRARGPAAALRGVAWSLLPIAAYLTGTLRLLWRIGDAVGAWAIRLAFSPMVWLGLIVLGISALLFVVSGLMRRRGVGTRGRPPRSVRRGGAGRESVTGASDDRTDRRTRGATDPSAMGGSKAGPGDDTDDTDDMDDIEAILRKHGIS